LGRSATGKKKETDELVERTVALLQFVRHFLLKKTFTSLPLFRERTVPSHKCQL